MSTKDDFRIVLYSIVIHCRQMRFFAFNNHYCKLIRIAVNTLTSYQTVVFVSNVLDKIIGALSNELILSSEGKWPQLSSTKIA